MAIKTLGQLPKYWTIGKPEMVNVTRAMKKSLSGYIGGKPSTGYWVNELSDNWRNEFNCSFAVPCNSGTSGLMAACMAADIGAGDEVWVSTYTMSATATAPLMLGANVRFLDIDPTYFCMAPGPLFKPFPKAMIITNLFGCAGYLKEARSFCDQMGIILIEDNAQAPFATYASKYTGTYGHMGIFSFNVHKCMQAGEGGIIVTDDPQLADRIEGAINHGELASHNIRPINRLGLNARMVEPVAAIACAQLKKGRQLVQTRIDLAEEISDMFAEVPFVASPRRRAGDVHSYYMWAGKIIGENACDIRHALVTGLVERGVPFKAGYSPLLHRLFEEDYSLPVAEELEDERLFTFEVCAYDPKMHHLKRMKEIILEVAGNINDKSEFGGERSHRGDQAVLGSHGEDLR